MKKAIFCFLLFSITIFCFSQHLSFNQYELIHNEDLKMARVEFDKQYTGISGTAFFTEDWKSGRAFINTKMYNNLKMKFDVYKNKIYINIHDTIFDISSGLKKFDLFTNDNGTSHYITFIKGFDFQEIAKENFVQLLASGKITLVKYYVKEINEVYESSPYSKQKKFIDKNKYYIISKNNDLIEVSLNKKNIEAVFNSTWDDIAKYAKEKKIAFNKEEGWVTLIEYYNTL